MEVDIRALGTFRSLAHEGAEYSAGSLSQLTGIDTSVDVTNVTLMSHEDVVREFGDDEFVGVQIDFSGRLAGKTVLAFDRETVATILEVLVPEASAEGEIDEMARSGVEEVGNIMIGGFIDGWADYLEASIDIAPPDYVERTGSDILPDSTFEGEMDDHVFVFESQMRAVDEKLNFLIYMLPEADVLAEVLSMRSRKPDTAVPLDKLSVFNEMTREGAKKAADNVTTMTGIDTDVDVSRLSFVPIEDVPTSIGDDEYVGVVTEFEGLPSGYIAFLFDEGSAYTIVDSMLPTEPSPGWGEMERSAIVELGNIMTSGFIDGWANVLETTIDHEPPQFVRDMGSSIMSPVAGRLGAQQRYAFLIDSTVRTPGDEFNCEIYAVPDESELREVLANPLEENVDQMEPDPELF
jgi:chemotaxis protein CheY-P-specific phosphatase CheC